MRIQGFTGVYMGVHENTGVYTSIQGFTGEYMSVHEKRGVYRSIYECT